MVTIFVTSQECRPYIEVGLEFRVFPKIVTTISRFGKKQETMGNCVKMVGRKGAMTLGKRLTHISALLS